jgi:hypothetical protein
LAGNAYERYGHLKLAMEHYETQAVKYLELTPGSDAALGFCYLAEAVSLSLDLPVEIQKWRFRIADITHLRSSRKVISSFYPCECTQLVSQ